MKWNETTSTLTIRFYEMQPGSFYTLQQLFPLFMVEPMLTGVICIIINEWIPLRCKECKCPDVVFGYWPHGPLDT